MPNWEAFQEADKRGILPPDKQALYQEAIKRGLAPGPTISQGEQSGGISPQQAFYDQHKGEFQPPDLSEEVKQADWKGMGPATGSAIGARLGMPFGLPGVVGGAAIGGAGGMAYEQIADYFKGKGPETSTEAIKGINEAAAFGGGGEMAGPAFGQLAAPISREMGPLAQ